MPSGLLGATQISTGTQHACVLKLDGSVTCWGARLPAVYMQAVSAIGLRALLCVCPDVQQQHSSAAPLLQATILGAKRPCLTSCHLSDRFRQEETPAFSLRIRWQRNPARRSLTLHAPTWGCTGGCTRPHCRGQYVELQRCSLPFAGTPRPLCVFDSFHLIANSSFTAAAL